MNQVYNHCLLLGCSLAHTQYIVLLSVSDLVMEVDAEAGLRPGAHLTVNTLAVTESQDADIYHDGQLTNWTMCVLLVLLSVYHILVSNRLRKEVSGVVVQKQMRWHFTVCKTF